MSIYIKNLFLDVNQLLAKSGHKSPRTTGS